MYLTYLRELHLNEYQCESEISLCFCLLFPQIFFLTSQQWGAYQQEASHCCPAVGARIVWYHEARGVWGRITSFHFHFNVNSNIRFWIEVGSQMPKSVKRIQHLKQSSPLFTPVARSREGECLIGLLKSWACLFYLHCLIESYEKKWQLTYSDGKSSWLNDSLNSRINRMCWNELVQNLVSLVFLLIISTLRSRLVGA